MTTAYVDDFAEHLAQTYRHVLAAFADEGLDGAVERVFDACYLLVATGPDGRRAEITDAGGPIPDSPGEAGMWRVTGPGTTMRVPGGGPPQTLAVAAAALLGA